MVRFFRFGVVLAFGVTAGACSSSEEGGGPTGCAVGQMSDCVCTDGSHGMQMCNPDGTLGVCMQCGNSQPIAPPPMTTSTTGPTSTTTIGPTATANPTMMPTSTSTVPNPGGIVYLGADPCVNYDTPYDGDEQCLAAPDPEIGFQLHYGPSDYDNPDQVAGFSLPQGGEVTDCMFMKSPNTTDIYLNEYHARLRPGSHHMITYQQADVMPDSVFPENCNQGPFFTFWVGATSPTTDIGGQNPNEPPEDVGLALKAEANSQLAFQMHFYNTGDTVLIKEGWVNVVYFPADQVRQEIDPITWLGGLNMRIPPGTNQTLSGSVSPPADVRIVTLVAHAHAHTVRVSTYLNNQLIYENYDWADPEFMDFNSVIQNPAPNQATATAGGVSGILNVTPGDQLRWECEVINDSQYTLTFGNGVYDKEMCNIFGVYTPSAGGPWGASSF